MFRVSSTPLALSEARINPKAASRCASVLQADTRAKIEVLVHPFAPLRVVHREKSAGELRAGKSGDEFLGGVPHRFGGNSRGTNLEQARFNLAAGGDATKRCREAFQFVFFGHAAEALGDLGGRFNVILSESPRGEEAGGDERGQEFAAIGPVMVLVMRVRMTVTTMRTLRHAFLREPATMRAKLTRAAHECKWWKGE
jgi:hypothetical protein